MKKLKQYWNSHGFLLMWIIIPMLVFPLKKYEFYTEWTNIKNGDVFHSNKEVYFVGNEPNIGEYLVSGKQLYKVEYLGVVNYERMYVESFFLYLLFCGFFCLASTTLYRTAEPKGKDV